MVVEAATANDETMNTRQLKPGDANIAVALVKKFHRRDVSVRYMARFLSNPSNVLLVAESEAEVIGFLSAHSLDSLEHEAAAMFIYEVEVDAEHRRMGAGTALINHIREIADARRMFEMFVLTNHSNTEAAAFYQATGGQVEEGDELMFVYPGISLQG